MATYRSGEFGGLSGLPALLTNWRQRGAQGGDIVGGEAPVKLAADVVRRADGTNTAMESGKGGLVAGGPEAAAASHARGKGHGLWKCYKYTGAGSVSGYGSRVRWLRVGFGVRAVRAANAGGRVRAR